MGCRVHCRFIETGNETDGEHDEKGYFRTYRADAPNDDSLRSSLPFSPFMPLMPALHSLSVFDASKSPVQL